jgi:pyruvate/2-oxoglutarate dehydrogenase complex dihydrolipoamide acyltransferase (E2) component
MPQMGESIAEGTIVRWIKKVGDAVDRDEPLFEISTDKVDAEIPSPAAGVLTEIKVKEGETVPVNAVVGTIGAKDEVATPAPAFTPALPQGDGSPASAGEPSATSARPAAAGEPVRLRRGRRRSRTAAGLAPRRRRREMSCGGRNRRRSCVASPANTTWTSSRCLVPASAVA